MRYYLIILCIVCVGCGSDTGQELIVPTVIDFPTETATDPATDVPPSVTATVTATVTDSPTPTPALQFRRDNLYFMPEQFVAFTSVDGTTPSEAVAFVVQGTLRNDSNRSECIYARDVRLLLNNLEYAPQGNLMSAYQQTLEQPVDYIGGFAGQCVNGNSSEPTFVVFDIPVNFGRVSFRFGEDAQFFGILLAPILRQTDIMISLDEAFDLSTQEGTAIAENQIAQMNATETATQWTLTPAPTSTSTATITLTPTITMTPVPSATLLPTATQTVEDLAQEAFANVFGRNRAEDLETLIVNDIVVTLRFPLSDLSAWAARTEAENQFPDLVCELREIGLTSRDYQITGTITLIDAFGNSSPAEGVEMIISASTIAQINCDADTFNIYLPAIADRYDIHPLIAE